jgi:hypothetical protein
MLQRMHGDHVSSGQAGCMPPSELATSRRLREWWRTPIWLLGIVTGSKSFVDNPVLGSRRLNRWGLHRFRVKAAHRIAWWRRKRLARRLPAEQRQSFDRDGYILIPDVLPPAEFTALRDQLLGSTLPCRVQQQGDTITSRVPVTPELLKKIPGLRSLLSDARWQGVLGYVSSFSSRPIYYLQAIAGGMAEGPSDPQLQLHADTFHPSMKAWLFLSDVGEGDRPLTYVAGSHRLTPARTAWERRRSVEVLDSGDRLSQRGSLRVSREELSELGLPEPTAFHVRANTLVAIDTCGFHARADSDRPSMRVEVWAYCRRSPFLPWTGFDLLSWVLPDRRAEWLGRTLDQLDRRGIMKQHWLPAGDWRAQHRLDGKAAT